MVKLGRFVDFATYISVDVAEICLEAVLSPETVDYINGRRMKGVNELEQHIVFSLSTFNDDFDLDKFEEEFEASFGADEETEEVENESDENTETEETEEETTEDSQTETKPDQEKPPLQTPEQNQAFQQMRQQLESAKRYEKFFARIAEQNGMTAEQVMEAYEQRLLEQQAQDQKVPVEVLQRMNKLEQENEQSRQQAESLRQQQMAERFNKSVDEAVKKYGLSQDDVRKTVLKAQSEHFMDVNTIVNLPFETVYRTVNFDEVVQKEIEQARQKELEKEDKKRKTSTIDTLQGESGQKSAEEEVEEEVLAYLRELGDID